jgi:hypothetical protein
MSKTRQRRLTGVDEMVLSEYAHGLTSGEIGPQFAQACNAHAARETSLQSHGQGVGGDVGSAARLGDSF